MMYELCTSLEDLRRYAGDGVDIELEANLLRSTAVDEDLEFTKKRDDYFWTRRFGGRGEDTLIPQTRLPFQGYL
jgi:hypothetical protein